MNGQQSGKEDSKNRKRIFWGATALGLYMTVQASRRQRPLSKGVPRQWRGMYNAGGASINSKSPFIIWTFCICFTIHTPRLRRTPLKRGLAVAVRLYMHENTIRRGVGVWAIHDHTNVTAAASPFTGVPRQWRGMY